MRMIDKLRETGAEPPIILDAAYAERLHALAYASLNRAPDVADRLLHEIERAAVVPSGEMPETVVNIGSEVTFRDDTADRVQTAILVLPQDADIAQRRISVLTPIGAALIGLAEGASIHWITRDGAERRLTVIKVGPAAGDDSETPAA
jgi:regulator of nucleoside diphosphate kinase